ncbi:MAG: 3'(2'),5'-bisphosphate nucleotidase CysQ [Nitrospirales bacterium]|nr:3'(2'),5'-bisphosphate nucleotidase CysQ [Nitrospira sp.]MDR4501327.1 3'(2'),5'-bisphosphate nucleotidase CysQ [Nitrospirales bacterium]
MHSLSSEVSIASDLAKQAGTLIMDVSQSDFSVAYKKPSDPVTEADQRANTIIVEGLHRQFPEDLIVAEESPPPPDLSSRGRVWYVDPLDGTKEFINKNGEFSVMIGLAINGRAKLGVVYQPSEDRLYAGIADETAWMETATGRTPLQTARQKTPELLTLIVSRSHRNPHIETIKQQTGISQEYSSGSVGLKIGLIARQKADVYIEPGPYTSLWDACAPEAIIRGAGGQFSDIYGNHILYGHDTLKNTKGLVATNGACHDVIIQSISSITEHIRG